MRGTGDGGGGGCHRRAEAARGWRGIGTVEKGTGGGRISRGGARERIEEGGGRPVDRGGW